MKRPGRSFRLEHLANRFDQEVAPVWTLPAGRLITEGLTFAAEAHVLEVSSATGTLSLELLSKLGPKGRLVAMDERGPFIDIGRSKADEDDLGRRLFFRTERWFPTMTFPDGAFDLTVSNMGTLGPGSVEAPSVPPPLPPSALADKRGAGTAHAGLGTALGSGPHAHNGPEAAIAELARVTSRGGIVRVTVPLKGTWQPFYDIADEVLLAMEKKSARRKLAALADAAPTPALLEGWLEQSGLIEVEVVCDRFEALFSSAEEFLCSPLVELVAMGPWRTALGKTTERAGGDGRPSAFDEIAAAFDIYLGDAPFAIPIVVGRAHGIVPGQR